MRPNCPVAQKPHLTAQPTWDDTHSEVRPVPIRRITDSINWPAAVRKRSLVAPSSPSCSSDSAKVFAVPEALLRKASEALGLSPKTVVKLLPSAVLSELFAEFDRLGLEVEARTQRLQARAGEALLSELLARDFNQSEVAEALGTSRTTLLKLMEDLRLPRANDLSAEQIEAARARVGGDLEATARLLRVSAQALKKRLASLQLR